MIIWRAECWTDNENKGYRAFWEAFYSTIECAKEYALLHEQGYWGDWSYAHDWKYDDDIKCWVMGPTDDTFKYYVSEVYVKE